MQLEMCDDNSKIKVSSIREKYKDISFTQKGFNHVFHSFLWYKQRSIKKFAFILEVLELYIYLKL